MAGPGDIRSRLRPARGSAEFLKRLLAVKTPLKLHIKAQRILACKKLLRMPHHVLQRVFWVGAATIYIDIKTGRMIVDTADIEDLDKFTTQEHACNPGSRKDVIRLKYFLCVNAHGGPVAIEFATGTTGFKPAKTYMRKTDGQPARGPTSEEFVDIMERMEVQIHKLCNKNEEMKAAFDKGPLLSYGNERIQNAADLSEIGFPESMRIPLPPNSPDMHKTIERAHALLKRAFRSAVAKLRKAQKPEVYMQMLTKLFFEKAVTTQFVERCVHSLPATYKAIIKNEGGWAPEHLR